MKAKKTYAIKVYGKALLSVVMTILVCSVSANAAIIPYLQAPKPDSVWVNWKTDRSQTTIVEYGESLNNLAIQMTGSEQALSSSYYYHSVKLTSLSPDTRYFYRIKSGTEISDIYSFKTPPVNGNDSGHIRILVMGDHQVRSDDRYKQLVQAAKSKLEEKFGAPIEDHIHLIVNVGDQVNVGTLDHYENIHFAQSAPLSPYVPIMTTVGNHETYLDRDLSNYQAHFIYNEQYYAGIPPASDESYYANQIGRVLFVHLNSMRTDSEQENWLRAVINAAENDDTVDWIISAIHHPYQAEQYVGDISHTLRDSWMAILSSSTKHALNLSGHHHLYARGQTRDWPTYHVISGGATWAQYWGQRGSTEIDFDDVQKTIANWNWQLIDIDIAQRTMTVESYGEAHPNRFEAEGLHLKSQLIDRFYRKLNGGQPNTPSLHHTGAQRISLPYSFFSSAFSSIYQDPLNSTHFQIAEDAAFTELHTDRIRDIENIYGDSGEPFFEPVDRHRNTDILTWTIPEKGLPNGRYFIRVRHRDANLEWSDWSTPVSFEVEGSTDGQPAISIEKTHYTEGESVSVAYSGGVRTDTDWIGIYRAGDTPRLTRATQWQYVSDLSGQVHFSNLAPGEYFVGFFKNDGYQEHTERLSFYVGSVVTLTSDKTEFDEQETIEIRWHDAMGNSKDWIGIYAHEQTPGEVVATTWQYAPAVNGKANFSGLSAGRYYAVFMVDNGYTEVSTRFYFSVNKEKLRGDIDNDAVLTLNDAAALRGHFGKCEGTAGFQSTADLNNDSCVNFLDYGEWLKLFNAQ